MAYEIFGNNMTELHTEELKTPGVKSSNDDKKSSSNDRLEGRNSEEGCRGETEGCGST